MSNKSWSDSIKEIAQQATDTAKDVSQKAVNAADDTYKKITGDSGSHSKLSTNPNFHSDARKIARDAERMKDDALRDIDRRFK
jgi:hypothetical protein